MSVIILCACGRDLGGVDGVQICPYCGLHWNLKPDLTVEMLTQPKITFASDIIPTQGISP